MVTDSKDTENKKYYHYNNVDMFLQNSEKFPHNESINIIKDALLFLMNNYQTETELNCSKDELITIARKVKLLLKD